MIKLETLTDSQINEIRYDILCDKFTEDELDACFKKDIACFFDLALYTFDPRKEPSVLPFNLYPFQIDFVRNLLKDIENGEKLVLLEKSRDMGYSRMLLGTLLYSMLYRDWSSLYGSYKEDYTDKLGNMDSAFERLRFMIKFLPQHLKDKIIVNKYQNIATTKAAIAGDSGKNFGVAGRRKIVAIDEFALWEHDEKAFNQIRDIADTILIGSTPRGMANMYGKLMTKHRDVEHLKARRYTLHRTLHPKKDQERYEKEKAVRTSVGVASELDISYTASVSGAVYPLFIQMTDYSKEQRYTTNNRRTFTGWDFGLDGNAVVLIQQDIDTGLFYIVDEISRENYPIKALGAIVSGKPINISGFQYSDQDIKDMERRGKYRYTFHFGDPYNIDAKHTNDYTSTIRKELRECGIEIFTRDPKKTANTTVQSRIQLVQSLLNKIYIDRNCTKVIEAFTQSRYPEKTENATSGQVLPIHNEYSHMRTAIEYCFDGIRRTGNAGYTPQPAVQNHKIGLMQPGY